MSIIGTASEEIKYGTLIEHQKEKENDDRYGKLVEKYKITNIRIYAFNVGEVAFLFDKCYQNGIDRTEKEKMAIEYIEQNNLLDYIFSLEADDEYNDFDDDNGAIIQFPLGHPESKSTVLGHMATYNDCDDEIRSILIQLERYFYSMFNDEIHAGCSLAAGFIVDKYKEMYLGEKNDVGENIYAVSKDGQIHFLDEELMADYFGVFSLIEITNARRISKIKKLMEKEGLFL